MIGGSSGRCRLCSESRPLQSSHLLPKALYRLIRAWSPPDHPDPIFGTMIGFRKTSRQVVDNLLCLPCEQRFHSEGENWVLKHCYRGKGSFRLQRILHKATPLYTGDRVSLFAAQFISEIRSDQLLYFAASVFWRAAVHEWHHGDHALRPMVIGTAYEEGLGRFLLGGAFPDHVAVLVRTAGESQPAPTLIFPFGGRQDTYHQYRFYIPGLLFDLIVGKRIPDYLLTMSIHRSPHLMTLSDQMGVDIKTKLLMLKELSEMQPTERMRHFRSILRRTGAERF